MQRLPHHSSPSLVTRVIGAIVTIATLAISLAVGFAIFMIVLGLGAILTLVFFARLYWLRRRFMKHMQQAQQQQAEQRAQADHQVIEGEYRVDRTDRRGW